MPETTVEEQHIIPSVEDVPCATPRKEIEKHVSTASDRDSGVYLSDNEDLPASPRPSSFSSTRSLSTKSTPQRPDSIARLRRPAELNLGFNATDDPAKPRSELDLRFDLIRNSKNQNKAALRSPTQLLQDRLNLSPQKKQYEDKVRIFTPPKPMLNSCILPGPAVQMEAFTGTSVRARTEKSSRPAWWCKFDRLVVFDGAEEGNNGDLKFKTRTSKGLSVARRRGDIETVVIPMDCSHCQVMLNRREWKYDIQVCQRGVCWDCRERCRWEMEQERVGADDEKTEDERTDANRVRADSVLQDEDAQEEELLAKIGIERRPKTPTVMVGGIEERLDGAASPPGVQ
ncbi:hypothetical protein BU23DRAFT_446742 [Bimuria novae-zelandiae CBS 107.79]|uniref:Uncharacterized protein n=1 Tax=Bimuria novae-zelandiae CBS 107.79 TaxID=1447943 RepID=A0A6A5VPA8_9PLEO|nr:hypothetical protein BU23DRAFT_446742 [Bimuria novae-zelandiae CBS 107.79]